MWNDDKNQKPVLMKKACKKCGRLFDYYGVGRMYCPRCTQIDAANFEKVKTFIYEKGPSNMFEIEEATGVDRKQIQLYLREGRLEIPEGSDLFIRCELCGAKLRSGRYCPDCIHKLSSEFITSTTFDSNEIGEPFKKSEKGKMHYNRSDQKDGK